MSGQLIGPPAAHPASETQLLWQALKQVEANQKQIEAAINSLIQRLDGIDAVAFASLALHDGKEFKLDTEAVARNRQAIKAVGDEMNRYRGERAKERQPKKGKILVKGADRASDERPSASQG